MNYNPGMMMMVAMMVIPPDNCGAGLRIGAIRSGVERCRRRRLRHGKYSEYQQCEHAE